jgi:hypothetical protein
VASDADCAQGLDWSNSFECTTNDPVDEVLVMGSCGLSPSSGCDSKGLLTVATVRFTAIAGGATGISGEIVKIKDDATTTEYVAIFAGTDQLVVIGDGGRRSLMDMGIAHRPVVRDTAVTHLRSGRHNVRRLDSGECDGLVLGDTNGDCAFDVEDVQYLQYYIGSPSNYTLNGQQLQAVDPDLDGDSDGVDIDYLMKVLANKYRFLANFNSSALPFSLSSTIRTKTSELASSQETSVRYEIGTTLNDASTMAFSRGKHPADTADGVVVTGEVIQSSPGVYQATASRVNSDESSVGVVLLIRTFDAYGQTSDSRQFSFYCSRLIPSCKSVYGDSSAAFIPFERVHISKMQAAWNPVMLVPFSHSDHDKLLSSMEAFISPFEPFSSEHLLQKIKLVLAFSRDLDDYHDARDEVAELQNYVAAQAEPWTRHFYPQIDSFSCNNTDDSDMYDPSLQDTVDEFGEVVRWVAGPNRQFEKMMRWIMSNIPNAIVFLKEFDSVPQMDNHFGTVIDEIHQSQPFYMLGR